MTRVRNWLGTLFIEDADGLDRLRNIFQCESVRYCIGQLERCPQSGRRHLQFYVEFISSRRLGSLKREFPPAIHWEPRRGSKEQAIEYCSKEDTREEGPVEWGDRGEPGKRSDLLELKQSLDSGSDLKTISQDHFQAFLRYERSISSYLSINSTPRTWEMVVYVLWGRTGSGKTRRVYSVADQLKSEVYPLSQNYKGGVVWWDGYYGQDIVLLDDFYGWLPWSYLLRLLDRYPLLVRSKAGHMQFSSKVIMITSNLEPSRWYAYNRGMSYETLERRFTCVMQVE